MKRRPPFALGWLLRRALPLLLGTTFLACEIQVARSSPDLYPEPETQGGWNGPDGVLSPERPRPTYDDDELEPPEPDPQSEPWLEHRELIAIDPYLVQGPLASNAEPGAPLSFRSQMEWLADSTRDPLAFVRSWFEQWTRGSDGESELPPVAARPRAGSVLIEPWLGPDPSGADAGYYLPSTPPSWANAPFALIAIVNRVDLASAACSGFAGELRYVYTALDAGSGDPLDMTIIVEIPYPTGPGAAAWARAWRDISALPPGEAHARAVEQLARDIQSEADPLRARVRSNELALGDPSAPGWELREFQPRIIGSELSLTQVPLASTPRSDADPAALAAHVLEHSEEIMTDAVPLPLELQAGAAEVPASNFSWPVLGVSERLRRAFSVQTCSGCHGGDTEALPFQHVAAGSTQARRARLSRFLYAPERPADELRRRSQIVSALANTTCAPPEPPSPYAGL